jgi:hypothetical protein
LTTRGRSIYMLVTYSRSAKEKKLTDPAPSTPTDLGSTLERVRAAIAAEGAGKGLAGKVQAVILQLLETLLAMLMEFRAGGLVAPVSGVSAPPPQPSPARAG